MPAIRCYMLFATELAVLVFVTFRLGPAFGEGLGSAKAARWTSYDILLSFAPMKDGSAGRSR
jgi:hypothetical protein